MRLYGFTSAEPASIKTTERGGYHRSINITRHFPPLFFAFLIDFICQVWNYC